MSTHSRSTFKVRAGIMAALAVCAIFAAQVHAGSFYGPRNTIPVERLPPVVQTCGGIFALSQTGPRLRFEKIKDLGPCPVKRVVRWIGPRGTIPVYLD